MAERGVAWYEAGGGGGVIPSTINCSEVRSNVQEQIGRL